MTKTRACNLCDKQNGRCHVCKGKGIIGGNTIIGNRIGIDHTGRPIAAFLPDGRIVYADEQIGVDCCVCRGKGKCLRCHGEGVVALSRPSDRPGGRISLWRDQLQNEHWPSLLVKISKGDPVIQTVIDRQISPEIRRSTISLLETMDDGDIEELIFYYRSHPGSRGRRYTQYVFKRPRNNLGQAEIEDSLARLAEARVLEITLQKDIDGPFVVIKPGSSIEARLLSWISGCREIGRSD
jgi:hypothetical protein